jgi:two-component system cell cycle sensor histidine kinase/response regulator CckA
MRKDQALLHLQSFPQIMPDFTPLILIVDDLAANRAMLVELLEGRGYKLVEAGDGPAALLLAAKTPPDLVLLDVMMPGMDGFEVCRQLRAAVRTAEVPIIMVTALDDQASRLAGIEAGADDFVTKPFNLTELRARVRTITRLNRYRRLMTAEAQLLRTQRVESIGMLAAGIAHDFNNAIAPLVICCPLLRRHVVDPSGQRLIDIMENSTERSSSLVRQLLSFASGSSGQPQLLQVRHVLGELHGIAQSTFPKSIKVVALLPAGLWPVLGDSTQIHQIFMNLCVNARDAMPQGGELTLTAANHTLDVLAAAKIAGARPGTFLAIEVQDSGTGIPSEVLARIWEPFFTTKGEGLGSGLGLSTVLGLVRNHGGFLQVKTAAGLGTKFTVYLPAAEETGGSAKVNVMPPARGAGELILVVDDEEPLREITAKTLNDYGYRAVTASDGADAIVAFVPRANEFRLLLTDDQMPILGGAALAIALRRLRPDLPIIRLGGDRDQPNVELGEPAPAILSKPFRAETLLSLVRHMLDTAGPLSAG